MKWKKDQNGFVLAVSKIDDEGRRKMECGIKILRNINSKIFMAEKLFEIIYEEAINSEEFKEAIIALEEWHGTETYKKTVVHIIADEAWYRDTSIHEKYKKLCGKARDSLSYHIFMLRVALLKQELELPPSVSFPREWYTSEVLQSNASE